MNLILEKMYLLGTIRFVLPSSDSSLIRIDLYSNIFSNCPFQNQLAQAYFKLIHNIFYLCQFLFQPIITKKTCVKSVKIDTVAFLAG